MKKLIIYILLMLNINIFAITTTYKTNMEIPGSVNIGTQLYLDNQPIGDYINDYPKTAANVIMDTESLFNLTEAWQSRFGAGRLYGGEIRNNGDGTVSIYSGCGIVKTVDGQIEEIPISYDSAGISANKYVCWDSIPALTLTDNAYNYIYYDGSEDTIKATTNFYSISFYEDFTIGRAYRSNGEVVVRLCGTNLWNFDRRVQLFGEEVFPVVRGTGLILADEGTRYISVTAGILWAELVNRFSIDAFNSTDASDSFTYWWSDGIGGYNSAKDSSQIDNLRYDNSGTLTELGNNKYGVFWVYVVHDGSVHIVYGTGSYSLSEAQSVNPPSSIPGLLNAYASLIGKIIILKSAAEITEVSSAFTQTFSSSIVQNHNDLGGLNVGDYLHLTAAEKAEFDAINDSLNLKLNISDSIVITKVSQLENDSNFASVDIANTFIRSQTIIGADTNGSLLTLQNLSGENIEIKAIGDYNYSIGWSGNFGKLTSGQFNISLGLSQSENKTGNNNIGIGNGTLNNQNLLDDNIAIGHSSQFNLYGSYRENTSLGGYSLYSPKGSYNTAIGAWAGSYNFGLEIDINAETGCLYLGAYSTSKNTSSENEIVIGYQAVGEGSNTIMLGNDTIVTTYIKGKITGDGTGLIFNDTIIYNSEILYESDTYNYYLEVSDTSLGFDISSYNISVEMKDTTTISGVEVWTGNYGSEFEGYILDNTVYRVYSVLRNYLVGEIRIRVYK